MAAAADRFGAHIFVRSRAKRIQRVGDRWEVKTATGSLRTARAVIATNAYSDELWPGLNRSIVKIHSWQVATEPLGDNLRATILPGRQAVWDTRGELGFFRYDARGRLVTGGATMSPMRVEERVLVRVGERLGEWFPALGEPRFDFAWRGYVGITRDFFPHLHVLGDGIFAWIGCNGRGVALAVALGRELAAVAAGADPAELSMPATPLATIPLHRWVQRIAPKLALWSYRRRDRREVRI
jgi:glycine/D-amino acid oxidase-like deaminating enzyme